MTTRSTSLLAALAATAITTLAGCGGSSDPPLPPEAEAGRSVYRADGCSACHGSNGQGGIGPKLQGLWGSEVRLEDGTTALADEAYLREAIVDPDAKIPEGASIRMPKSDLEDDEVDRILRFIEAIGPDSESNR